MSYSANAIANFFVAKSIATGKELTPMKLIKLVYIAHGWNLALFNNSLIDELVEAWRYGPVVPSVYHAFKKFGNDQVNDYAHNDDGEAPQILNEDTATRAILDRIWEIYGDYTGVQLSNWTHEIDSPWFKTWHEQPEHNRPINNIRIKEYYTGLRKGSN